jgi:tetratricopeptide (TPR) repeat protein
MRRFPVRSFSYGWPADLGRCLRKLRRFEEAKDALTGLLKQVPAQPYAHYELALVYADTGRLEDAIAHLESALAVWAEADRSFRPAQRARDKLAELTGG